MIQIKVNDPQADIIESTAQRNLFHSGVGIGKSQCIGLLSMEFVKNNPEIRGFIGANTYSQLSKSTLDRVFKVWTETFGLKKDIDFVVDKIPPAGYKIYGPDLKSYENTISFANGAMIFIASLDNYKVIDGTEFGWACLDETKDTKEEAVKEVIIARLRQIGMFISERGSMFNLKECNEKVEQGLWKIVYDLEKGTYYLNKTGQKVTGYNPLYIFTSPAKTKWLMEWFHLDDQADGIQAKIFDKDDYYRKRTGDQFVVIASTYHNAHNLSSGYVDRLIEDLGGNKGLIDMLIYGSPFGKSGGEFYSAYDRMKHVKKIEVNNKLPIHISLDFNLVPYITMTLWQIELVKGRYKVRCFAELCLENPHNNTEALCKTAEAKFGNLFRAGLFYYGDYSGKNGNMMTQEYKHHFDVVDKVLKKYVSNYSDKVIVNPFVMKRRDFANKMLNGGFNIDIEIDSTCKNTLGDFEFLQVGPDGGKLKKKVTDKSKGMTYEEHGHTSDTFDYFICSAFSNLFDN